MTLRDRTFFRISLLLFLLIAAINAAESYFEFWHRENDTRKVVETRVIFLAQAMDPLILQNNHEGLHNMLERLKGLHSGVKIAFIEKDQELYLSSSPMEIPPVYWRQRNPSDSGLLIRKFQDKEGEELLDVSVPIGENTPYVLHAVLVKSALRSGAGLAAWTISGLGFLAFLITIPLALSIANHTTKEVDLLTKKLSDHRDQLENLVKERTTALKRFEHIASVTTDHMSFIDTNYIYRAVNNSYLDAFKKSQEEIVGSSIAEIHGIDVFESGIKDFIDKCLQGESIQYQAWFDFPGLGRQLMDVAYFPFKEDDGKISGVVVSSRDITEKMQAEDLLRESEERFRTLFSGVSVGVAIYDAVDNGQDFVFLDYNPAGQKIDNSSAEEAIGRKITEVFPGAEEFGILGVFQRVWESGIPEEHPVSIYKDSTISAWRHNYVFKLPSGEVVAVYTDETARMQAKEHLQAQHDRFTAVMDSLDAVVYVADMETHELLFANKLVRDQFGDCIGKPCWQAIQVGQSGPCDFCTNDRLLDQQGRPREPWIWEVQNTADKQWYQCRDQAISWPDGRLVRMEIATNITDRKLTEQKIESSLKEKDVLLREIHHRVKNNMQVVTSLLNLQARKISDEQALTAIRESQDRIHVMSLVHESLYQSDDLNSIAMKQYFTRLADDIARLHSASAKSIQYQVVTDDVTLCINDAIPVGLIANELLTNAFKHAFADGSPGKVQIVLQKMATGKMELIVSDNGVGIPESVNPLESKTLGLQLVIRLTEGQLGGTFEVVRESGSAFHIQFGPEQAG
jgi:PAS domain S-box-containing protein